MSENGIIQSTMKPLSTVDVVFSFHASLLLLWAQLFSVKIDMLRKIIFFEKLRFDTVDLYLKENATTKVHFTPGILEKKTKTLWRVWFGYYFHGPRIVVVRVTGRRRETPTQRRFQLGQFPVSLLLLVVVLRTYVRTCI